MRRAFSPGLERAYRAADYCVFFPEGKRGVQRVEILRVGENPRWLMEFMEWLNTGLKKRRVRTWALITACNPHSRLRSRAENQRAQARLREALRRMGLRFLRAENRAGGMANEMAGEISVMHGGKPAKVWHPEPAFFIPGLSLDRARQLARSFSQNAFLYGTRGGAATLQPCRGTLP